MVVLVNARVARRFVAENAYPTHAQVAELSAHTPAVVNVRVEQPGTDQPANLRQAREGRLPVPAEEGIVSISVQYIADRQVIAGVTIQLQQYRPLLIRMQLRR